MTFSWPVFAIGLILGVLQLGVGVVVGRSLPIRGSRGDRDESSSDGTAKLARRLQGLLTSLSNDVGRQQIRIEQMTKDISAPRAGDTPDLAERVLRNVALITQANRRLQSRLAEAESQLTERAAPIESPSGVAPAEQPSQPDDDLATISHDLRDRLAEVTAEA